MGGAVQCPFIRGRLFRIENVRSLFRDDNPTAEIKLVCCRQRCDCSTNQDQRDEPGNFHCLDITARLERPLSGPSFVTFVTTTDRSWPTGASGHHRQRMSPLDPVPPDAAGRFGAANTKFTMPHLVYSRSYACRPSARKETTGAIDRPNKAESEETLRPIRNP